MFKRRKVAEHSSDPNELSFEVFATYVRHGKIEPLKTLGARKVLDATMELILEGDDREVTEPNAIYAAYGAMKFAFWADKTGLVWPTIAITYFELIGFSHNEIRDAFAWFYQPYDSAIRHDGDRRHLAALQKGITAAFHLRGFRSPFE